MKSIVTSLVAIAITAPPPAASPLPTGAAATAAALTEATIALEQQIDAHSGRTTPPISLWALRQQRIYLELGLSDAQFAGAVIAHLPPRLRADARDTVKARRALVRLTPPTTLPLSAFHTGPAEPANQLLSEYKQAQRRFHVPWQILAAVNFVETAFGRLRTPSTAGAQGPMQFLPQTWQAYGLGGNINNPHDAILAAANFLHASGAPRELRAAVYSFNRSSLYVDAILAYARILGRNRNAYYEFYAWHVFVRTAGGYRRLTIARRATLRTADATLTPARPRS